MDNNNLNIQEDEIDLKELFNTIIKRKKFIFIFTSIVTVLAIIYALQKTSIYEAHATFEIASYKNKVLENPNNLIKRLKVRYIDSWDKNDSTQIEKISLIKGTSFIEIVTSAYTNKEASKRINTVLEFIKNEHEILLDEYLDTINVQLDHIDNKIQKFKNDKKNLEKSIIQNQNKLSNIIDKNAAVAAIYIINLNTKTDKLRNVDDKILALNASKIDLKLSLSKNNIKNTKILEQIITNEHPIKPKKKLIVIVAFVTALILSIFLVFFLEFISSNKNEEDD